MNEQAMVALLLSMRGQIDAMLTLLEPKPAVCEHPIEARLDASTMGCMRWTCRACGYEYEEKLS